MKVNMVFIKKNNENFFGVKIDNSNLYFCSDITSNKTGCLFKRLMEGKYSWVSTKTTLEGIITKDYELEVNGKTEEWLMDKVKEFEFLVNGYNRIDS